jgi:hypothetical protein
MVRLFTSITKRGNTKVSNIPNDEWKPLTEAAREFGISSAKLSKMAKNTKQYSIRTRKDPRDERLTLVNMEDLRKIFN